MDDEPQDAGSDPQEPGSGWGRAIDAAGILAAIVLAVIAADIWTDGRLISRRLQRRRGEGEDVERAS